MLSAFGKTPLRPHIMILFREFLENLIETIRERDILGWYRTRLVTHDSLSIRRNCALWG